MGATSAKDKLIKMEMVNCELTATIIPGDKRCLSFYRSFTHASCRECDLADKINKMINPVYTEYSLDIRKKYSKVEDSPEEPKMKQVGTQATPNTLDFRVIRVRGCHIAKVLTKIIEIQGNESGIEIKGCARGFKENGADRRGKLTWFPFTWDLVDQVNSKMYYEIKLEASIGDSMLTSIYTEVKEFLSTGKA
jgi:hypothetical protein